MSTFLETFGLFLAGVGLAFWLGRVSRDKEIDEVKRRYKLSVELHEETWKASLEHEKNATTAMASARYWQSRAINAEAELAKPKPTKPAKPTKKR